MDPLAPTRIMFTSGGGPGAWGLLAALRSMPGRAVAVFAQDPDDGDTLGCALADQRAMLPPASAADYCDLLLTYCRRHAIDVLIPVYDGELVQIARRRQEFEAGGTAVLLPPERLVTLCVDKAALHTHLAGTAFVSDFVVAHTAAELGSAVAALGYPRRRLCVKPVNLAGGRGVHVLDAATDTFRERLLARPGVLRCTAEEFAAVRAAGPERFDLLITEYLPGDELGIDLLARDGEVIECVVRRKGGSTFSGNPMRMEFRDLPSERRWICDLAEQLRLTGLLNIDARYDDGQRLRLLEINPRPSACIGMSCTRVHLLGWAVDLLLGDRANDPRRYYARTPPSRAMRALADVVFAGDAGRITSPGAARELPATTALTTS